MAMKKNKASLSTYQSEIAIWVWKTALVLIASLSLIIPGLIHVGWLRIPTIPFLDGMATQPKAKAQSVVPWFADGIAARPPVARTVPVNGLPIEGADLEGTAPSLVNPLPVSKAVLHRGEIIFDRYCQPCHGFKGLGDGSATGLGRVPAPPSLHSDTVRSWLDGEIYRVITLGQNTMPSYAKQLDSTDRWAAVRFVRVLHRALLPQPGDLATSATLQESVSAPVRGANP